MSANGRFSAQEDFGRISRAIVDWQRYTEMFLSVFPHACFEAQSDIARPMPCVPVVVQSGSTAWTLQIFILRGLDLAESHGNKVPQSRDRSRGTYLRRA
jgi:hypothetical protein